MASGSGTAHRRGDPRLCRLAPLQRRGHGQPEMADGNSLQPGARALPIKVEPLEVAERPPLAIPFDPTIIEELSGGVAPAW